MSAAFPHQGGSIPVRYTCEGANVSPPLSWGQVPAGTEEMFVIAFSLSTGIGGPVRWAVAGIPPSVHSIGSGQLPAGAVVGRNSEGHTAWAGSCPTKGGSQGIITIVYALARKLSLAQGFQASEAQRQIAGQTLAAGLLYGTYKHP